MADGDGGEEVVLDLVRKSPAVEQLPERRAEVAGGLHLLGGKRRAWGVGSRVRAWVRGLVIGSG